MDQVVDHVGGRADDAVLLGRQAEEKGEFEVAEAVDLVDEYVIRHDTPGGPWAQAGR